MGNVNNKRKNRETSITFIVTKAVYLIGFGILALGILSLFLIIIIADKHIFNGAAFAKVEGTMFFGYIAAVIILTIAVPFLTSRKLKKSAKPILEIIEKIKKQNLDFEISYGRVKEINDILAGMDSMKKALEESLEKQWSLEQNRKKQISALAHDFKTPMTVLKGNIDLIESSTADEVSKEYIEDAQFSLSQMEQYLNTLLDMTRAEKGYTMNLKKIEICSVLKEIISPFIKASEKNNIYVIFERSAKEISVYADRILFGRLINNLISNALDYVVSEGKIIIKADIKDENAVISVADSGPGFTANALKHAMEQFYMDDISRNRKNHYGLGLFICNQIVKQHKGKMMLSNDENTKGAKITIYIPLIKEKI